MDDPSITGVTYAVQGGECHAVTGWKKPIPGTGKITKMIRLNPCAGWSKGKGVSTSTEQVPGTFVLCQECIDDAQSRRVSDPSIIGVSFNALLGTCFLEKGWTGTDKSNGW